MRSRVAGPVVPGDAGFAHLTPLSRSRAWRDGQTQSSTQKGPVFLTVWCGSPAVCTGGETAQVWMRVPPFLELLQAH